MSHLRRSSDDHRSLGSAINAITRNGAAPATVEPLSDLSRSDSRYLREHWNSWPVSLRHAIVSQMASLGDEDLRVDFERALIVALSDDDPDVRLAATMALWEAESSALLEELVRRIPEEPEPRVRVAMIEALGRFARLASEGRLPAGQREEIEGLLVETALHDPNESVWLEAMAAAAHLRPEALESRIFQTFDEGHDEAREIALRAMGRFGGNQWASRVIDSLRAGDSDQRMEAARAAPYIGEQRVVPYLYEAAEDDDEEELQLAAIAALGEIAGREVRSFLEELRDSTEGDVSSAAETALANAELLDGVADGSPI